MAAETFYSPFIPAFNSNGLPIAGAQLRFRYTGTTTPAPIYTNAALTVAHANPVVANAAGRYAPIYLDDSIIYRVDILDDDGAQLDSIDPYIPGQALKGDPGSPGEGYGSRTALTAAAVTSADDAYLTESGYEGKFVARTYTDVDEAVAINSRKGYFNRSTSNTAIAWVAERNGELRLSRNGTADHTGAQEIIDLSIYGGTGHDSLGAAPILDVPLIELDDTLHIGYGSSEGGLTAFKGVHVTGLGDPYGGNYDVHNGTAIVSTVTTKPCVNIQAARDSGLHKMWIEGPAKTLLNAIDFDTSGATYFATSAWDTVLTAAGLTPSQALAPKAVVAIDAYLGTKGATFYADANYPAWSGISTQYGKASSSMVSFEDITLTGNEVGLAVQCYNGTGSNGDWIRYYGQNLIENCKVGIAFGGSQLRLSDFGPIRFRRVHTCVDTASFGGAAGARAGGRLILETAEYAYQLFKLASLNTASPMEIWANCEQLVRIGETTGGGSSATSVLTLKGKYNLRQSNTGATSGGNIAGNIRGVAPYLIKNGGTESLVIYLAAPCELQVRGVPYAAGSGVQAKGMNLVQAEVPTKDYHKLALNACMGGIMFDPLLNKNPQEVSFIPFDLGGASTAPVLTSEAFSKTGRDTCVPFYVRKARFSDGDTGTFEKRQLYPYLLGASKRPTPSRSDRAISFTNSDATGEDRAYTRNLVNGCVAVHRESGTILALRSTDYSTGAQVWELLNNYVQDDGTAAYSLVDTTWDPASGIWYCLAGGLYAPKKRIFGDITSASAVITNVRTVGGTNETNFGLTVGDRMACEYMEQAYFVGSSSSTNNSISSISTGSSTITMGRAASVTATNVPLDFWYRAAPANASSR